MYLSLEPVALGACILMNKQLPAIRYNLDFDSQLQV